MPPTGCVRRAWRSSRSTRRRSPVFDGANTGTLGSSGEHARTCDELQFLLGEGPCLDSVTRRAPVLVVDLADPEERAGRCTVRRCWTCRSEVFRDARRRRR